MGMGKSGKSDLCTRSHSCLCNDVIKNGGKRGSGHVRLDMVRCMEKVTIPKTGKNVHLINANERRAVKC